MQNTEELLSKADGDGDSNCVPVKLLSKVFYEIADSVRTSITVAQSPVVVTSCRSIIVWLLQSFLVSS